MRHCLFTLLPLLALAACSSQGGEVSSKDKALLQMADKLQQTGNTQEALGIYARLAEEEKDGVEYHLELAKLDRKLGRPADAVVVMRDAQAIRPEDPRVLSQLGYSLLAANQTKEALEVFSGWVKEDSENAMAYNGQAIALDHAGDHEAAQATYDKALALNPHNATDIQNNKAMSLILAGQYKEAIALLEPLVKNIGSKTMRQNLALAYGMSGDKKRALEMNLKDLPADKARENMRFYESYARRLKKGRHVPATIQAPNQPAEDGAQDSPPASAKEPKNTGEEVKKPADAETSGEEKNN